jgi:hypothetical protein
MSASDHLSELQFDVYRGMPVKSKESSEVGIHWSASPKIASMFATSHPINPGSDPHYQTGFTNRRWIQGHILKASIPLSSVETDTKTLNTVGNTGAFPGEKEVTAKRGAAVFLHSKTTLTANDSNQVIRKRTRTYKKPREMKA